MFPREDLFVCLLLFLSGPMNWKMAVYLFVIISIGVGCLQVFFYYFLIVFDGSRGGFVVVFFSFHFFRSGSMEGDGWGRLVAALLAPSRPSAQASRCQKEFSC